MIGLSDFSNALKALAGVKMPHDLTFYLENSSGDQINLMNRVLASTCSSKRIHRCEHCNRFYVSSDRLNYPENKDDSLPSEYDTIKSEWRP
jgi:hypothetical protein